MTLPVKVWNVPKRCHDGPVRMGDLTFLLYRLEYERRRCTTHHLKFYIPDENIFTHEFWGSVSGDFRLHYKHWLEQRTDYFSAVPGDEDCPVVLSWWGMLRDLKDLVAISNPEPIKPKICIFPLVDAKYNQERNWPRRVLDDILREYSQYEEYERIICCANELKTINAYNFTFSTDFGTNLQHLLECEIFVGGDTGFTHLAGALDKPKRIMKYYYAEGYHGGWTSDNSLPLTSRGTPIFYKRFETDTWNY
jgi:hypothetical protein